VVASSARESEIVYGNALSEPPTPKKLTLVTVTGSPHIQIEHANCVAAITLNTQQKIFCEVEHGRSRTRR
jgi:hypothetical protein